MFLNGNFLIDSPYAIDDDNIKFMIVPTKVIKIVTPYALNTVSPLINMYLYASRLSDSGTKEYPFTSSDCSDDTDEIKSRISGSMVEIEIMIKIRFMNL